MNVPKLSRSLVCVCLGMASCTPEQEPQSTGADASPDPHDESGGAPHLEVPAAVRRNLDIRFAGVESRHVESTRRFPGAFELEPRARREYHMSLAGRVELLVDQFETVEAGQVLYRFLSPEWPELVHEIIQGDQAIDTAEAELTINRAELREAERKLELLEGRIATLAEVAVKRADLELEAAELEASMGRHRAEVVAAETRLANARSTRVHALHHAASVAAIPDERFEEIELVGEQELPRYETMEWIDVRAEEPGVVEALFVTNGAFVQPADIVLATVQLDRLRFRAQALQADLPEVAELGPARIVPPHLATFGQDAAVDAELALGIDAHPLERTLTLLAAPREVRSWMRPGVAGFVELVVDASGGPALAIPRAASTLR